MRRALLVMVVASAQAWAQPSRPAPVDPWAEDPAVPPTLPTIPPIRLPPPPMPPRDDIPVDEPPVEPPPAAPVPPPPAPAPPPPAAAEPVPPVDDETIAPSQLPVEAPPKLPRYPRSFVERPLMLPDGLREGHVTGTLGRETVEDFELLYAMGTFGATVGLDGAQVNFGINLLLYDDINVPDVDPNLPVLQRIYLSVGWELPSETVVSLQGVIGNAGSRFQRYSPSLFIAHKIRTSASGAIYVSGGVDYNYGNEGDSGGARLVSHRIGGYAGATARVQTSDDVALQVSASFAQFFFVDDHRRMEDSYHSYSGGGAMLVAINETTDLAVGASIGMTAEVHMISGGLTFTKRTR
jgi:hypothetical protein